MAGYNYTPYIEFTQKILLDETLFSTFKQNPSYTEMLEHVNFPQGCKYLQCMCNLFEITEKEIEDFCALNDKVGEPTLYEYSSTLTCSPTSLRYIFHSLLILQHMKGLGLSKVSIVEVGCGYGGLFLALQHFAPKFGIHILHYACIDLQPAIDLQKKYISKHTIPIPITFHDASQFGKDVEGDDLFLVSTYCFSEISDAFQAKYREYLFPKCSHGFIAWNMIDVYDIGKSIRVEDEIPVTGPKNKFVYF